MNISELQKMNYFVFLTFGLFSSVVVLANTPMGKLELISNSAFEVRQNAESRGTQIYGIDHVMGNIQFYVRPGESAGAPLSWAPESRILESGVYRSLHGLTWNWVHSSYSDPLYPGLHRFTTMFETEDQGFEFYGYASGVSEAASHSLAIAFIEQLRRAGNGRSLTDQFIGKKYYLGFGDDLSGFMGNEVKYDIDHTHNIFTSQLGGEYDGTKVISESGGAELKKYWSSLREQMTFHDMYVQYSSGHGYQQGLAFGVTYNQIRDATLALPAKEVVIFIMACHSGGLVDSFNAKKAAWENWGKWKRTLFVLASSKISETSSTGPGKDPDEPNGPSGSAGSAFGHALWKALIGYADGYGSGVKDGFISIGEIIDFSIYKTKQVGGHTPVYTGVYSREMVMNRVPTELEIAALGPSTEGLSDSQIADQIRDLDNLFRVR